MVWRRLRVYVRRRLARLQPVSSRNLGYLQIQDNSDHGHRGQQTIRVSFPSTTLFKLIDTCRPEFINKLNPRREISKRLYKLEDTTSSKPEKLNTKDKIREWLKKKKLEELTEDSLRFTGYFFCVSLEFLKTLFNLI
jgi:hypothetical protein